MDYLSLIRQPIAAEMQEFTALFREAYSHSNGLLAQALQHILQKTGKQMRPMLILLMAKNFGRITDVTLNAAVGLESLHTASLVHDDIVDESRERRGQASTNAEYGNQVAVLVGDYILSTALLYVSKTHSEAIVHYLSSLGQTLSEGEIMQLSNIQNEEISEELYYEVIKRKTAALFEACSAIGAESSKASPDDVEAARLFGQNLGIIFQIRDDIFDYYDREEEIGKPTGNDMAEGKLTLPVIYALNKTCDGEMLALAHKVKRHEQVSKEEIARLVAFAKEQGGIEYADSRMWDFHKACMAFIESHCHDDAIKAALKAYLDFVIEREK